MIIIYIIYRNAALTAAVPEVNIAADNLHSGRLGTKKVYCRRNCSPTNTVRSGGKGEMIMKKPIRCKEIPVCPIYGRAFIHTDHIGIETGKYASAVCGPLFSHCLQLIIAETCGSDCRYTLFERQNRFDKYLPVPSFGDLYGHCGRNGAVYKRRSGTLTTPLGLFKLGFAFGTVPPPEGLSLPFRRAGEHSVWVCDYGSRFYNSWQEEDTVECDWSNDLCERLTEFGDSYRLGCVIEYNTDHSRQDDSGSAIFLHCGDGPTAGCLSLPEDDLTRLMVHLDPAYDPSVFITDSEGLRFFERINKE